MIEKIILRFKDLHLNLSKAFNNLIFCSLVKVSARMTGNWPIIMF